MTIRMDKNLKKQADHLFGELGMSFTTAVTLFTKQCIRDQKIPFEIRLEPNSETIAALNEFEAMKKNDGSYKEYDNLAQIIEEIEDDSKNKKI